MIKLTAFGRFSTAVIIALFLTLGYAQSSTERCVVVALSAGIQTLDATKISSSIAGSFPMSQAFEGLTVITPEGQVAPALATSWVVSEDELSWTFELRQGVTFHDGSAFNAEVVKANVDRWLDPNVQFSSLRNQGPLVGAEVISEYTIRFHTSEPYSVLPGAVAHFGALMHNPSEVSTWGEDLGNNLPSGTGPFKVVEYVPRELITFERWDSYWGEQAASECIQIRTVPDDNARLTMLQTGEADISFYVPLQLAASVAQTPGLTTVSVPTWRMYVLHYNMFLERYQDVRVREALNLAVDREAIIDGLFQGFAVPPRSMLPEGVFAWAPVGEIDYDSARAEALLTEAGWLRGSDGVRVKDGVKFEVTITTTAGAYPMDSQLAQVVGQYLEDIGLDVSIFAPGDYTIVKELTQTDANAHATNDLVLSYFGATTGDPIVVLNVYAGRFCSPAGINVGCYANDRYDELSLLQDGAFDPNERSEYIREMQEIAMNDYPALFLLQGSLIIGVRDDIQGLEPHGIENHRLTRVVRTR